MDNNISLANYLLSKKGFEIFLDKSKKQYQKFGSYKGVVQMILVDDNKEDLLGFFGYHNTNSLKINKKMIDKAIANSKFDGANFDEVLKIIYTDLKANKDVISELNQLRTIYIKQCLINYQNSQFYDYYISNQISLMSTFNYEYSKNKKSCKELINNLALAYNNLPSYQDEIKLISVYSNELFSNSHLLDDNNKLANMFFNALLYQTNTKSISTLNDKMEVYLKCGLIQDEVSNFSMICHLLPLNNLNKMISYQMFYDTYEPLNLSLANLRNIDGFSDDIEKVFVVENPSVFIMLMYYIKNNKINVGLICTGGQINKSGYEIIDLCVKANYQIYYAGDFDPEGLLIANKLIEKYNSIILWGYTLANYYKTNPIITISDKRLSQLDNCLNTQTLKIKQLLQENKKAGYQESLLDYYKQGLNNLV